MVDLHTHTNESDGSLSPDALIDTAAAAGIRSLAITDHDTFEGYLRAREKGRSAGIDLICGIELSTRDHARPIHMLGYFLYAAPTPEFVNWLGSLIARRKERNAKLAERLGVLGVPVSVAEAEALGRTVTGRVHFARVMVQKNFARSIQDAFKRYLGEGAPGYVEAADPPVTEGLRRLREAGAISVLAHPGRYGINNPETERGFIRSLASDGLGGLEVIHTDHRPHETERYSRLAEEFGLLTTGGSDYHGDVKPGVRLGYGDFGRILIPTDWLDRLRERAPSRAS